MERISKVSKLAIFLMLGLIAISTSSANAMTTVPLKASITAALAFTSASTFTLTGIGDDSIASHLGKVGYTAAGTFTSATTDNLTETLISANGDNLTLFCIQVVEQLSPTLLHGIDSTVVISGTGRFVGATGSATGETYIDLSTNTVKKTMSGSISY